MPKGFSNWLIYLLLTAIAILVVLSLAGQMGVVRELKHYILEARKSGLSDVSFLEIIRLHRRFTGLLIVSFFGFLLLCAGLITVMQHTRDAFHFSEAQDRVRGSLKKTLPGILMLAVGTLALAIANYGYSYLERRYSVILSGIHKNYAVERAMLKPADTIAITTKPTRVDSGAQANQQNVQASSSSISLSKNKIAEHKKSIAGSHSSNGQHSGKKSQSTHQLAAKVVDTQALKPDVAKQTTDTPSTNTAATNTKTVSPTPVEENAANNDPIRWAISMQRRVVMFGYVPTRRDREEYNEIIRVHSGDMAFDGDMRWAYGLVTKALDGFQPTMDELHRYERIVSQSLASR